MHITSVLVGSDACMLRTEQCNFKFQLLKLRLFKFFFYLNIKKELNYHNMKK